MHRIERKPYIDSSGVSTYLITGSDNKRLPFRFMSFFYDNCNNCCNIFDNSQVSDQAVWIITFNLACQYTRSIKVKHDPV